MNTALAEPFQPDDEADQAYLDWLQADLFGPAPTEAEPPTGQTTTVPPTYRTG